MRRDWTLSFVQYHDTKSRTRKSRFATHDDDPGTSLDFRTGFRFSTCNVISLGDQGCDLLVVRKLSRLHLSITALTEVGWPGSALARRWPGSGTKTFPKLTVLWSSDNKQMEGVALDSSASRALISWRPISECLLTATFKYQHGRLQLIATSTPTRTNSTTVARRFHINSLN